MPDDSRFLATNENLARAFGSKSLRYAESETVKHIEAAIESVKEASRWADDTAILGDILKELQGARDDIVGDW